MCYQWRWDVRSSTTCMYGTIDTCIYFTVHRPFVSRKSYVIKFNNPHLIQVMAITISCPSFLCTFKTCTFHVKRLITSCLILIDRSNLLRKHKQTFSQEDKLCNPVHLSSFSLSLWLLRRGWGVHVVQRFPKPIPSLL